MVHDQNRGACRLANAISGPNGYAHILLIIFATGSEIACQRVDHDQLEFAELGNPVCVVHVVYAN